MTTFSSGLTTTITNYLTLKRALGRQYSNEERLLAHLDQFLAARHVDLVAETFDQVVREHDVDIRTGVLSDQTIELTSARSRKAYPGTLRRVGYWDEETRRSYVFVTNNTTWVGKTIANLYKSRWQIELFFKWVKQHLKVKRFVGRTKNAVLSQLWVATCMYLLLAYLKFVLRLSWSLHQMLRVLQLNLFDRRPLVELFTTPSPPGSPDPQMLLWRLKCGTVVFRRRPPYGRQGAPLVPLSVDGGGLAADALVRNALRFSSSPLSA